MASARQSVALMALAMTVAACGGSSADIRLGVQPMQANVVERASLTFAVSVSGSFSEDVDWELDGTGSLDPATGVYTAPDQVPAPAKNFAIVRARSRVDSRVFAEASVRIVPPPFLPRRGPVTGGTSVVLEGEDFGNETEVFFGEVEGAVDVLSPNLLRAVVPPSAVGIAPVDVRVVASPGGAGEIYPLAYHYAATTLRFPGAVQVPTCDGQDLTIADIDGDGDLDIATGCLTLQRVLVLRNDGAGFLSKEDVLTEGINPMELVFGDPDGDGVPDLAVLENDRIEIFANDGNVSVREPSGAGLYRLPAIGALGFSSFAQAERLDAGARPDRLLAADFDGDGLDDLIASDSQGDQLTLFPTGESTPIVLLAGDIPGPVAIHDMNRDGLPDLLVTSRVLTTTAQIEVFLALAPGVFGTPESYAFNGNPVDMTLSDVDGDDLVDVIVATQGPDAIVVLRGRDDGELGRAEPVPIGGDVRALVAHSMNGGLPDVVVVDGGSRGIRVLRNRSE